MTEPKRMGRPTKAAEPGTRVSLGLKVTPEMKTKIDAAARLSGRTQSQEAEYRINSSLSDEDVFPHKDLKFWAYYMTSVFHQRGKYEASTRGCPDMTIAEWMGDPLIYQSAMFEVIRSMIMRQPRPERGAVEVQLAALSGLFHNLRNDLLGIDPLKTEGEE